MICIAQGSTLLRDKASFDGKWCAAQYARLSDFVSLRSEVRSKSYAVQPLSDNVWVLRAGTVDFPLPKRLQDRLRNNPWLPGFVISNLCGIRSPEPRRWELVSQNFSVRKNRHASKK